MINKSLSICLRLHIWKISLIVDTARFGESSAAARTRFSVIALLKQPAESVVFGSGTAKTLLGLLLIYLSHCDILVSHNRVLTV